MPESCFAVGNVEIVGLTDIEVEFPMPLTQLFPHVPLAAWASPFNMCPDLAKLLPHRREPLYLARR